MKWTDLVYQNEWRKIMALRNIREIGDDILYKKAKEVK